MSGFKQRKVTIGLPVYNGERYLEQAVDSILAQTFTDFELILTDNASTDATEAICRHYEEMDSRVRYIRHRQNMGVAGNFNAAFAASNSKYFRWAAYDDLLAPTYLERCVHLLDQDETLIGAHSLIKIIDESGKELEVLEEPRAVQSKDVFERYRASFLGWERMIWSVMRSNFIRRARPMGAFPTGEWFLLAELALLGRFGVVPEPLFEQRTHLDCYSVAANSWSPAEHYEWWGCGASRSAVFQEPRYLSIQAAVIARAPLPWGRKLRCWRFLGGRMGAYLSKRILSRPPRVMRQIRQCLPRGVQSTP